MHRGWRPHALIDQLGVEPDHVLIDGNWDFVERGATERIVRGDATSLSISAASILAKVTRDRLMRDAAEHYPVLLLRAQQGLSGASPQGGAPVLGPSAIHRRSWAFMDGLPWTGSASLPAPDAAEGTVRLRELRQRRRASVVSERRQSRGRRRRSRRRCARTRRDRRRRSGPMRSRPWSRNERLAGVGRVEDQSRERGDLDLVGKLDVVSARTRARRSRRRVRGAGCRQRAAVLRDRFLPDRRRPAAAGPGTASPIEHPTMGTSRPIRSAAHPGRRSVPPDEAACQIAADASLDRRPAAGAAPAWPRQNPTCPSASEAPSGMTHGSRPPAATSAATSAMTASRRSYSAGSDEPNVCACKAVEQEVALAWSPAAVRRRSAAPGRRRSPRRAAASAVARQWFDWAAPHVIDGVGTRRCGCGEVELELAHLVAGDAESGEVVALDPDGRAAPGVRQRGRAAGAGWEAGRAADAGGGSAIAAKLAIRRPVSPVGPGSPRR